MWLTLGIGFVLGVAVTIGVAIFWMCGLTYRDDS